MPLSSLTEIFCLLRELKACQTPQGRRKILLQSPSVKNFFAHQEERKKTVRDLSLEHQNIFLSLIAMGIDHFPLSKPKLEKFLEDLAPADRFFDEQEGLVRYQAEILSLIHRSDSPLTPIICHSPPSIDIRHENALIKKAIVEGIKSLPFFAEIYAVGGAADRLHLKDPKTGEDLPAACLVLDGKTLFSRLIEDLQAKEYLYYKIFGIQITTPIALMTSQEKNNHEHIRQICEKNLWFGRPSSSFHLFDQPLVPMVDREGKWQVLESGRFFLKPGGHGVLWKLAEERGVLKLLEKKKRKKLLIRQINNPIAGVDYGLIAFTGLGFAKNKKFGFASCERFIHTAEGMDTLIEKGEKFVLSNVEYCDFQKFGLLDEPREKGSPYSKFPSNTNLLFADIAAMRKAVKKMPLPGKIMNFKEFQGKELARLETTMQNIADSFEENSGRIKNTFLTFNTRRKTISSTKRQYEKGGGYTETPEACFYDMMVNAYELLTKHLHIQVDPCGSLQEFLNDVPFVFTYAPTLGPLYSIIAQKIQYGSLARGSILRLDIAEVEISSLSLKGSLKIEAEAPLGKKDRKGLLHFHHHSGRLTLKNVRVENSGGFSQTSWNKEKKGGCHILLKGFSEFYAENVVLKGNLLIEVEEGTRVVAKEKNGKLVLEREKIKKPSWSWSYTLGKKLPVKLKKITPK